MVAYTPNRGYSLPTVAGDLNQWGVFLNQGTSILDNNMGGQAVVNVAGSSDVTATSAQAQNLVQSLTGVLTGNISYLLPNVGSFYIINNATTGAFTVTVKTTGGGSIGPIVPQNTQLAVYSRGGNVWIMDGGSTGGTINNRTFRGALTVESGGAYIVGNSTVSGFLTATGGLGVNAFGANIVGDSVVSGFLTVTAGLGVNAFGANIVGNSVVTGALTVSTAGSSGNQVTNYSQFAQVNGNPGYISLPGGYRRAFGTSSVVLGANQATISFGTTITTVRKLTVSNGSAPTSQEYCTLLGNNSVQFILFVPNQAAGDYVVSWDVEGWA